MHPDVYVPASYEILSINENKEECKRIPLHKCTRCFSHYKKQRKETYSRMWQPEGRSVGHTVPSVRKQRREEVEHAVKLQSAASTSESPPPKGPTHRRPDVLGLGGENT